MGITDKFVLSKVFFMVKQSVRKKVSEGLKMRGALIMSILILSSMLTCASSQDIRIIHADNNENEQDEPQFVEYSNNDYINYQSVEYEEMLLVVREMAMEFDELRNKTLETDEYGLLA